MSRPRSKALCACAYRQLKLRARANECAANGLQEAIPLKLYLQSEQKLHCAKLPRHGFQMGAIAPVWVWVWVWVWYRWGGPESSARTREVGMEGCPAVPLWAGHSRGNLVGPPTDNNHASQLDFS